MIKMEFPPELEGQIHQMVVQLGNLLSTLPTQTDPDEARTATAEGIGAEAMVGFTSRLQMDVARRTLLSACASYEAAAAVHRMLTPEIKPHA